MRKNRNHLMCEIIFSKQIIFFSSIIKNYKQTILNKFYEIHGIF